MGQPYTSSLWEGASVMMTGKRKTMKLTQSKHNVLRRRPPPNQCCVRLNADPESRTTLKSLPLLISPSSIITTPSPCHSGTVIVEYRARNLIEGRGIIDLLPQHTGKAGHRVRVLPDLGSSKRCVTLQLRSSDLNGVIPHGSCKEQFTFKGKDREATTVSDVVHFKKIPETDSIHVHFSRPKLDIGITDELGSYRCVLIDAKRDEICSFESPPGSLVFNRHMDPKMSPSSPRISFIPSGSQDESIYMDIWDNLLGVLPNGFLEELQRVYEENGPHTNENFTDPILRREGKKRRWHEDRGGSKPPPRDREYKSGRMRESFFLHTMPPELLLCKLTVDAQNWNYESAEFCAQMIWFFWFVTS
ncbi:hypothetical protein PROFUN_00234 [Planoprotostelium fungivorum]|uniref:Uncharacterized protein n=1 Tax=Planoprotostelium fungivorum TaxID=1890364 RepID=A0A2P6NXU7_9EUKA|nr:hypothetical protein PROFUN_00234 [Planoprotostelium fungivorum]